MPEIPQLKSRQEVNDSIIQFTKAHATNTPQWTSNDDDDDDNNEQRIVPDPLKLDSYHQNGLIKRDLMMKPLSLDVDPNAWELDADQLEFQQLIGNIRKYKNSDVLDHSLKNIREVSWSLSLHVDITYGNLCPNAPFIF